MAEKLLCNLKKLLDNISSGSSKFYPEYQFCEGQTKLSYSKRYKDQLG